VIEEARQLRADCLELRALLLINLDQRYRLLANFDDAKADARRALNDAHRA
jgi:hypothetical protein